MTESLLPKQVGDAPNSLNGDSMFFQHWLYWPPWETFALSLLFARQCSEFYPVLTPSGFLKLGRLGKTPIPRSNGLRMGGTALSSVS